MTRCNQLKRKPALWPANAYIVEACGSLLTSAVEIHCGMCTQCLADEQMRLNPFLSGGYLEPRNLDAGSPNTRSSWGRCVEFRPWALRHALTPEERDKMRRVSMRASLVRWFKA